MNRSGETLAVVALCLLAQLAAAQVPAAPQFRYGAPIDVESFLYRREIPAGKAGVTDLQLDAAALSHSSPQFADLRIVADDGRQVPYLIEKDADPLSVQLPPLDEDSSPPPTTLQPFCGKPAGARGAHGRISRYVVRLPYTRLPDAQLVLSTTARVFEREVWLEVGPDAGEDRADIAWRIIADAGWSHTDPERGTPALRLGMPPLRTLTLHLVVNEGDNEALPFGRPALLLPAYHARFVRPANARLQLVYGNRGSEAPRYDLALVARSLLDSPAEQVTAAPERPGPAPGYRPASCSGRRSRLP